MKLPLVFLIALSIAAGAAGQGPAPSPAHDCPPSQIEANKQLARDFYRDLWFTDNTDRYSRYLAETYVVHDIRGRKGVTEPAVEQKNIADRLWRNGTMHGEVDFQIANCDVVATRWHWWGEPRTLFGRLLMSEKRIPIINVFRIEEGQIVEIWNHRHDIDTPRTWIFVFQGLAAGLLIALLPLIWALRLRRKLKREQSKGLSASA